MYLFFCDYADVGAPSFTKFARLAGLTTADIERFRSHERFEIAYNECKQIRRDYLIDRALEKRFDSSLTKYLLSLDEEEAAREDIGDILVQLEVKE